MLGTKVATVEDAETACQAEGNILAMERDVTAAFENGLENCECGWISNGSGVTMIHDPRADCNDSAARGVNACAASDDGFVPICVVDA